MNGESRKGHGPHSKDNIDPLESLDGSICVAFLPWAIRCQAQHIDGQELLAILMFTVMGSTDEAIEIDVLERHLLSDTASHDDGEAEDETIVYDASFKEMEDNYVKYQTAQWVLYSLLLILAWGIGLFMLFYLPVRRYISRKEFQSRKLYVTPNAIVYKYARPVPFPCFGVLKKEKHVLLPSVADIVVEQGYFQSLFGIYSVRIENAGVRRPASDDVQIQGVSHPSDFRKAVLAHLSTLRNEGFAQQVSTSEDQSNYGAVYSSPHAAWGHHSVGTVLTSQLMSPSRYFRQDSINPPELLLQKLEEVGRSVKVNWCRGFNFERVESLIERHSQASEAIV
ncbi:uncharacterized protein LOC131227572 isoform X2 [Magnolia sinica]|uniref:uncharacterized protein LOC131227572 isoform X2 n=1 Tax=Magnolia sinica TaxID=86752 RepID=UPI002657E548|nr:uncharacterized protein LOC131227572 isoform X2 [Magnolia sinica]XP_058079362.1 uncharacterized protein LOC131227572 isoform X2 [Magnolia sinica]